MKDFRGDKIAMNVFVRTVIIIEAGLLSVLYSDELVRHYGHRERGIRSLPDSYGQGCLYILFSLYYNN